MGTQEADSRVPEWRGWMIYSPGESGGWWARCPASERLGGFLHVPGVQKRKRAAFPGKKAAARLTLVRTARLEAVVLNYSHTEINSSRPVPGEQVPGSDIGENLVPASCGAAPPTSNTGVLTAQGGASELVSALIDWVGMTLKGVAVETVLGHLGGAEIFVPMERGAFGYTSGFRCGNVTVLHGDARMGVHVSISGQGCRELEARGLVANWGAFLGAWRAAGAKFTRLDVAADDRAGLLTIGRIRQAIDEGNVVSRWRSCRFLESRSLVSGEVDGETLYFGSRSSEKFARFYNKGQQIGEGESFVRMELQVKNDQAEALASLIVAGGNLGDVLAGVVRAMVDFKVPGAHSQRERWASADWWTAFLGQVEKLRLTVAPVVRTAQEVYGWVRRQVAPSLALLVDVSGDWTVLADLIEEGRRRWRPTHRAILAGAGA